MIEIRYLLYSIFIYIIYNIYHLFYILFIFYIFLSFICFIFCIFFFLNIYIYSFLKLYIFLNYIIYVMYNIHIFNINPVFPVHINDQPNTYVLVEEYVPLNIQGFFLQGNAGSPPTNKKSAHSPSRLPPPKVYSPTKYQFSCYNAIRNSFLAIVIAPVPFLF